MFQDDTLYTNWLTNLLTLGNMSITYVII